MNRVMAEIAAAVAADRAVTAAKIADRVPKASHRLAVAIAAINRAAKASTAVDTVGVAVAADAVVIVVRAAAITGRVPKVIRAVARYNRELSFAGS
jgi:hypothetical protein